MPNFEKISQNLADLNKQIELARVEMEFYKPTPIKLAIKPMYLVVLYFAIFLAEIITAVVKKSYKPNIWLYCIAAGLTLFYVSYAVFSTVKQKKNQKELNDNYQTKQAIYESLRKRRIELFAEFVSQTNGIEMQSVEDNQPCYVWFENDELIIAKVSDKITLDNIEYSDIKYISCDLNLFDYNKYLGEDTMVGNEVPYAYIFTANKCYLFFAKNYSALCELIPEKELLFILKSKNN